MSKKHRGHAKGDPVTYQTPLPAGGVQMETFLPWTLVRRGLKKQVITPFDAPQEFLDEARGGDGEGFLLTCEFAVRVAGLDDFDA